MSVLPTGGCPLADPDDVTVSLTPGEAFVLFELLHRWEDDEQVSPHRFPAEQVALWNLPAALEKVMREPFHAGHDRLVSEARTRLTPAD